MTAHRSRSALNSREWMCEGTSVLNTQEKHLRHIVISGADVPACKPQNKQVKSSRRNRNCLSLPLVWDLQATWLAQCPWGKLSPCEQLGTALCWRQYFGVQFWEDPRQRVFLVLLFISTPLNTEVRPIFLYPIQWPHVQMCWEFTSPKTEITSWTLAYLGNKSKAGTPSTSMAQHWRAE